MKNPKERSSQTGLSVWQQRYTNVSAREIYRSKLLALARQDGRIFCLDSDMGGLEHFEEALPNQYADVGIAEANMMSVAAGLAKVGWIPFAHTMANFAAARANEQIKLDIARNNAPVKIVASHGGVSGGHLGPTHHALDDIALLRTFPNMTIIVPCDAAETEKAIEASLALPSPVYIRLGRKVTPLHHQADFSFQVGKAHVFAEGDDLAILSTGPNALKVAMEASARLREQNIFAQVANIHTVKPLDTDFILQMARDCGRLITIEEHSIFGGLGSAVAEVVSTNWPCHLRSIGTQDYFFDSCGDEKTLLDVLGINVNAVLEAAESLMSSKSLS